MRPGSRSGCLAAFSFAKYTLALNLSRHASNIAGRKPRGAILRFTLFVLMTALVAGCATTTAPSDADKLTVGTVQREIKMGMSGADVASVLGAPNIVTTDEQRREVWVYDKMATTATYSRQDGVLFALILAGANSTGAASTSQQTLTVVIKFDENKNVRDFAYHSSSF